MDDEDFCDYGTPIGKIIQHINTLCKKPKIDEELGSALDLFNEKITEQQMYLKNGIFNINFAEAALFLQSCATLYGKKIDLLWEQLLDFHTRLIRYDCEHAKEKGKKFDKNVVQQLEERRNRYKRKKKFKLVESHGVETKEVLFDVAANTEKNQENRDEIHSVIKDGDDDDFHHFWKHMDGTNENTEKVPKIVDEQQRKRYRLENYPIMESEDFDIYDIDDGEFNTKYSRVPGWHHIEHLIEYNTLGLLPDSNNIIANFRLSSYGRLKFMRERKIPLSTPYKVYERDYLIYKQKFFEEEAKKWQNMPLNTFDDLHRQMEFLAQMERERDNPKRVDGTSPTPNKNNNGVILCCEDSSETISSTDSLAKIVENSDDDSLFELSFQCDEEMCKSDLFIRLEKLSADIINTKLRQDSGFFDYMSDSSSISSDDREVSKGVEDIAALTDQNNPSSDTNGIAKKNFEQGTEESSDDREVSKGVEDIAALTDQNNPSLDTNGIAKENFEQGTEESSDDREVSKGVEDIAALTDQNNPSLDTNDIAKENFEQGTENITEDLDDNERNELPTNNDDFDTRSIISDHDYCTPSRNILSEKNNNTINTNMNITKEPEMLPFSNKSSVIPKIVRLKLLKIKHVKDKENDGSPPEKRRKLSQKQFIKLVTSLVPAVKQQKFEKFFSLNYQPQLGEGFIEEVDYESTGSDIDDEALNFENEPIPDIVPSAEGQPRQDDNQSVFSDHDYCNPSGESDVLHDSGFKDASTCSSRLEGHEEQPELIGADEIRPNDQTEVATAEETATAEEVTTVEEVIHTDEISAAEVPQSTRREEELDEQYIKLLAALKESRKEASGGVVKTTEELHLEQELKLRERQESRARVDQWRKRIMPIIKDLKESDFDIHEYGSRIMDNMEINDSKPFKDIVNGQSSAEVVRYFISSLQLANTNNIEICGVMKGEISNDTYHVKLLKRDRYHEHLTDYHAPSEETFKERLQRMRDTEHKQVPDEPKMKRAKMTAPTKKKPSKAYTRKTKSPTFPVQSTQLPSSEQSCSQSRVTVPLYYAEPSTSCSDDRLPSTSALPNCIVQSPTEETSFREHLQDMQEHNSKFQLSSTPQRDRTNMFPNVNLKRSVLFD